MPTKRIGNLLRGLKANTSGNAMLLVAMGAPILFGTTGLAVDTAQWYMWQRELQYAADQAALAGAWARGTGDTGTEYKTRASQEFTANVNIVNNYTTLEASSLEDYDGGNDNSVVVTASTEGTLPFASFMLGGSTTVRVKAQATYEHADQYTACLLALDKHGGRAVWFHGSITLNAPCGTAAVSDATNAISSQGNANPAYNVGWVVSGGGVDDKHGNFGDAEIVQNSDTISDPFEHLTPPNNPAQRTITCGATQTMWTATKSESRYTTYKYFTKSKGKYVAYNSYPNASSPLSETFPAISLTLTSYPTGSTNGPIAGSIDTVPGSPKGNDAVYVQANVTTTVSYANIVVIPPSDGSLLPGTYTGGFDPGCDVKLRTGIYVVDGGELNFNGQNTISGSGVMFVLKNGAGLKVNGGASMNLSPMTTTDELIAAGVSADQAKGLINMLIFEDPKSQGNTKNKINGNATTNLNGTIYLPRSGVDLLGNMKAKSSCLMIAAKTLEVGGNADLTSLCASGKEHDVVVAGGSTRVRLVA